MIAAYLSVHMTGGYADSVKGGSFQAQAYPDSDALRAVSVVKDVFLRVGADIIVLYNSVLLKKRILVYSDDLPLLQKTTRTLPQLAWHRQVRRYTAWKQPDTQHPGITTLLCAPARCAFSPFGDACVHTYMSFS